MAEEKKNTEETTEAEPTKHNAETPSEESSQEPPKDEPKTEEKAEEKSEEGGENEKTEEKSESAPEAKSEEAAEPAPPQMSEEDRLREENFRLTTQLEAMKIGFNLDVIEDAVVLAENIVKKDGSEISDALQAVAKKYPDWTGNAKGKNGKASGGFKIGADSSKQSEANDEKIRNAFGIKKKN